MMTQDQLKELLSYSPVTGKFIRIKKTAPCVKIGEIAGGPCKSGYTTISLVNKRYYAHRLAFLYMTGEWPIHHVDHINHIPSDNRWENLRHATVTDNVRNASMSSRNTSGITGVVWSKGRRRWMAYISLGNKTKGLGSFKDKFEAICARKSAESKNGFHENHGRTKSYAQHSDVIS